MHSPIYLDANATTRLLPAVAEALECCHRRSPLNPASTHTFGRQARGDGAANAFRAAGYKCCLACQSKIHAQFL